MDRLSVVVKICNYAKIVVVPLQYIYKLNFAKSLNNRINRNQTHLMFWSEDLTKEPNFDIPISTDFSSQNDACYNVKLLKVFGEYYRLRSTINSYAQRGFSKTFQRTEKVH